uniref:Uncharacterized protein n=2 Tax=Aegilops tauschii subsp. strangulata TaxID=200361 RepID=A0A453JGC7_AEGTS
TPQCQLPSRPRRQLPSATPTATPSRTIPPSALRRPDHHWPDLQQRPSSQASSTRSPPGSSCSSVSAEGSVRVMMTTRMASNFHQISHDHERRAEEDADPVRRAGGWRGAWRSAPPKQVGPLDLAEHSRSLTSWSSSPWSVLHPRPSGVCFILQV